MDRPLDGRIDRLGQELADATGAAPTPGELTRQLADVAARRPDPESPSWLARHLLDVALALAAVLLLVLFLRAAAWTNTVAVARADLPAGHVVQSGELRLAPAFEPRGEELVLRRAVTAGERLRRRDLERRSLELERRRTISLAVTGAHDGFPTPRPVTLAVAEEEGESLLIEDVWILEAGDGFVSAALYEADLDRLLPHLATAELFLAGASPPAAPTPGAPTAP